MSSCFKNGLHHSNFIVTASKFQQAARPSVGRILKWQRVEASIIGWLLQTKALIIFANILLDKGVISSETFTALLLMAVASTMLTVPMVAPKLARTRHIASQAGPRRPLITPVTGKDLTPR